jgi:hypothetical protein
MGLGGGGGFSSGALGSLSNSGPQAASSKLVDPLDTLLVADLPELALKAQKPADAGTPAPKK